MKSVPPFRPSLAPQGDVGAERYVHVHGTAVWVDAVPADPRWDRHFLGMHGNHAVWAVDVPHGQDPSDGAAIDLYGYHGRVSETEWLIAGRAVQIVEWSRTHRFCGRCGMANQLASNERAMVCPQCRLMVFPRLAPAIITLVTRGEGDNEEALLARGATWPTPMYSCLAGFVEPGETLEEAVVRETEEEVGLVVRDVRYIASQPWPFPHSLMLGFRARYDHGDIVCDTKEIADARWFTRDALPQIPGPISIARKLIDGWLVGEDFARL